MGLAVAASARRCGVPVPHAFGLVLAVVAVYSVLMMLNVTSMMVDIRGIVPWRDDRGLWNASGTDELSSRMKEEVLIVPAAEVADDAVPADPRALWHWVDDANSQLAVLNEDKFGTIEDAPVSRLLVVQVHHRPAYLRALLEALSRVRGVESALLVLSLDVVDAEMLAVSASFCRVLRVFFPYSMQIWPDEFPGGGGGAASQGGRGGHVRDAKVTMAKHHWWWLHNFIFNDVYSLTNYSGAALFLEEDMYVSPDILHVLGLMERTESADMYVLNDNKGLLNSDLAARAEMTHWVFNMGVAMGLGAWAKIVRCARFFCTYDDYNHDWSLQATGVTCVPGHFTVMVMKGSRVFHIGKCGGMHFKGSSECDAGVREVRTILDKAESLSLLFPAQLTVGRGQLGFVRRVGRPNGGWSEPRDHQLCLDNANASLWRYAAEHHIALRDAAVSPVIVPTSYYPEDETTGSSGSPTTISTSPPEAATPATPMT